MLKVKNLSIGISQKGSVEKLVRNVSLQVSAGKVLGLVGESGCGKTMTCLSLLHLLPPGIGQMGGAILLDGKATEEFTPDQWREIRGGRIALIMQNPMSAFDPIRKIGAHFIETIQAHRKIGRVGAEKIALEFMAKVGLGDGKSLLGQYPFQLSGGMLQRVMIAIALAQEPVLMIADEPTTALDATSQVQILDLLENVQQRFRTGMLLISHDLGVIARLADHVAVMYRGEIVEQGPAVQLLARPRHPYTVALLEARRRIAGKREGYKAAWNGEKNWDDGCSFRRFCGCAVESCEERVPSVTVLTEEGHWVRCLRYGQDGLEAV